MVACQEDLATASWISPGVKQHPENGRITRDFITDNVGRHVQVVGCKVLQVYSGTGGVERERIGNDVACWNSLFRAEWAVGCTDGDGLRGLEYSEAIG